MHAAGPKNPLHGITLQVMVTQLVEHYGWEMLGRMIPINCFNWQPSIKSSLVFLRRTPWARDKVEALYLDSLPDMQPESQLPPQAESEAPPAPTAPQDAEVS
ncbi:MAG: hypothetical protein B7Z37_21305 [Verrucomicrobia bacterium 12-59-8]|nr:MAG: hypothetical protein B7Z37_21305 [Verrucomicrobia bacterium 12-59-8]